MRRIGYVVALAAALALVSIPVVADHVTEPQTPISSAALVVYAYPNFSTRLTACDGSEVVKRVDGTVAKDVRMETFVNSTSMAAGNPSEHWTEEITLFVVTGLGTRLEVERYEWSAMWRHSNIPPHAKGGILSHAGWESSQNNQRLDRYAAGTILRFRTQVIGDESAIQLEAVCTFKVG